MALKQDIMHFVLCSKQGNKIEGVVLNRVYVLGIFCPKRDQGFKPSVAHLYPNMGRVQFNLSLMAPMKQSIQQNLSSDVSSRSIDFVAFLTKFRLSHYGVSICLWTWITSSSLKKKKTKENLKYNNGRKPPSNHFVSFFVCSFARLLLEGNSSPVLSPWKRERLERDPW